jgi:signal transduction histidine kinase
VCGNTSQLELSSEFLQLLLPHKLAENRNISHQSENERRVYVDILEDATYNIIKIIDNAGGIQSEIMNKIFDPYFTTKHQSQGTGIGLYMSKDIVEKNMKGELSVQNVEITIEGLSYKGACFKIAIPKL